MNIFTNKILILLCYNWEIGAINAQLARPSVTIRRKKASRLFSYNPLQSQKQLDVACTIMWHKKIKGIHSVMEMRSSGELFNFNNHRWLDTQTMGRLNYRSRCPIYLCCFLRSCRTCRIHYHLVWLATSLCTLRGCQMWPKQSWNFATHWYLRAKVLGHEVPWSMKV